MNGEYLQSTVKHSNNITVPKVLGFEKATPLKLCKKYHSILCIPACFYNNKKKHIKHNIMNVWLFNYN